MRMMEADHCEPTSYYSVLGLSSGCSIDEIRRAYRKLAMKWHPDRYVKNPSLLSKAKRKFQQIQEAYAGKFKSPNSFETNSQYTDEYVLIFFYLADQRKRTRYDAGIQDFNDEEDDEGMCDFMQELWSLMAEGKRRKEKSYSLEELQGMLKQMAEGFSWSPDCEITQCSQGIMF